MEKTTATTVFESLASGVRLDVFRLLVRQGPEGLVAGEIAAELELPPTNLSFHLKALTQAGLKEAVFDPAKLVQNNRSGRKLMQAYFRQRGVIVKFSAS